MTAPKKVSEETWKLPAFGAEKAGTWAQGRTPPPGWRARPPPRPPAQRGRRLVAGPSCHTRSPRGPGGQRPGDPEQGCGEARPHETFPGSARPHRRAPRSPAPGTRGALPPCPRSPGPSAPRPATRRPGPHSPSLAFFLRARVPPSFPKKESSFFRDGGDLGVGDLGTDGDFCGEVAMATKRAAAGRSGRGAGAGRARRARRD